MGSVDFSKYPTTAQFKCCDEIGIPHPYMIMPRHVAYAADHHGGILDMTAIEGAERAGAKCGICMDLSRQEGFPILPWREHHKGLLIEVYDDRELKDIPELHGYLLSIKEMAEADGFFGFAFKQGRKKLDA